MRFLAVMAEEQEPGRRTAADDEQHAHHRDHQLELALRRGCALRLRRAFRLFVVSHRPVRSEENQRDAAGQAVTRYKCPQRTRASLGVDAKVAMVNGIFFCPRGRKKLPGKHGQQDLSAAPPQCRRNI